VLSVWSMYTIRRSPSQQLPVVVGRNVSWGNRDKIDSVAEFIIMLFSIAHRIRCKWPNKVIKLLEHMRGEEYTI